MAFYPVKGKWGIRYFRKKASTAFAPQELVAFETDGLSGDPINPADASDTTLIGICMATIASTDSDYADNTRIAIMVPEEKGAEMFGDVGTGTLVVADEGLLIDLKDKDEADRDNSAKDVLIVTRFLSGTTGHFSINKPSLT